MPSRSKKKKRNVTSVHTRCRSWGHRWYSYDVQIEGGKYIVHAICQGCSTDRFHKLDAQGYILSCRYVYPEDYLLEGGVLRQAERARLRLSAMGSM